jgi:signal peptidase II
MKLKYLLLAAISGAVITLDQVTKFYIHTTYRLHESTAVVPGFFNLTYVRNPGAAFGFLAESAPAFREAFFLSLPPLAVLLIIWFMRSLPDTHKTKIIALSLIFGGALGNYIDRLRFKYVIDFLDFHYQTWSWPAFNIADSCIVIGVSLMILMEIKNSNPKAA